MHDHFLDQKKDHTVSHNPKIDLRNRPFHPSGYRRIEYAPHVHRFMIIRSFWGHLERAYAIRPYKNTCYVVSHNNFQIKKNGHDISLAPFSDQKKDHAISHNLKLILEIDLFVRQGRGVLNTPHMYMDF